MESIFRYKDRTRQVSVSTTVINIPTRNCGICISGSYSVSSKVMSGFKKCTIQELRMLRAVHNMIGILCLVPSLVGGGGGGSEVNFALRFI